MLDKLKQTAKHTSIFAFGKVSAKLVGFILLPIYTKEISVSDYGVLGLLEIIELLGSHILSLGLPLSLMRWNSLETTETQQKRLVFTNFAFLTVVSVVAVILVLPFKAELSKFFFDSQKYANYFVYVFGSIAFITLSKIPQTILRIEEKSLLYSVSVVCQFTLNLILNIYFVALKKWGVEGILIAHLISNGVLFLILLPYLIKKMTPSFTGNQLKEMLIFGLPFVLSSISATVLNLGDRYLLTKLSTLSEVGLYSLGYKFSNILKIFIVDSFALGLPIVGWKVIREDNNPKRFFSKTLSYIAFILIWVGIILSSYAKGIIHLFALDKSYWDAYMVVPYLVLGVVFVGMQKVFFFELQIPQKTKSISLIITTAAIVNVLLNLILIPYYGMLGSAYATVLAQFWSILLAYYYTRKYYPVQYEMGRILKLFGVGILLFLITGPFDDFSLALRIVFKGLIILSYPFILHLLKFYEPVELDRISYYLRKIFRYDSRQKDL